MEKFYIRDLKYYDLLRLINFFDLLDLPFDSKGRYVNQSMFLQMDLFGAQISRVAGKIVSPINREDILVGFFKWFPEDLNMIETYALFVQLDNMSKWEWDRLISFWATIGALNNN